MWKIPQSTQNILLPITSSCIPINIQLEKQYARFIWCSLNSHNKIYN